MRVLMFRLAMLLAYGLSAGWLPLVVLTAFVSLNLKRMADRAELEYLLASVDQKIKARRLVQQKEEL